MAQRETRKSLSVEHTYAQDLPDLETCLARLPALFDDFSSRLARQPQQSGKAFVKIKFHDFSQTTMERTGASPSPQAFAELIRQAWLRGKKPVRLIGVGIRFSTAPSPLPLWA